MTRQFEGRRWTLPAQVYAAPLELYAGLSRCRCRRSSTSCSACTTAASTGSSSPGTYRWSGERIDVALRPARFADETRAGVSC